MSAAEYKDQGNKHLQAKEFDAAISCYTKAIELNPNDHVFYSNRSAAYLSLKKADKALEDANSCVRVNPSWAKGYSRQGAAFHALKKYDEAIKAYESGLKIAPDDAALKSGLEEVKQLKQQSSRPAGGGIFDDPVLIQKLVTSPKFGPKLADPAFRAKLAMMKTNPQMVMQDPEMMEVLQLMFSGAEGEDFPEPPKSTPTPTPTPAASASTPPPAPQESENLTEEEKAERNKKTSAQVAKERGNTLYKEKKFTEALAAYDEAISLDPSNIMFLNNKAAVYIEMGEIDTAIACCNEALEIGKVHRSSFDDKAKVYQRIAAAELKRNNIAAGIKAYEKSQMEKYDKAIERKIKNLELDLKKAEKEQYINPTLGAEAKERGNTAFREGNFAKAIEEYEEAIKRDPTNAAYHNNLAATFCKTGLFNDAKRHVDRCLELDGTYVKGWAKKGDIAFFMKEYHKALDAYKTGLSFDPENQLCKDGLQKTFSKINSSTESEADRNERVAHAMADPEIQNILNDPAIRRVLQDAQEDPKRFQAAYNDPICRAKIDKLVAAGVLKMG